MDKHRRAVIKHGALLVAGLALGGRIFPTRAEGTVPDFSAYPLSFARPSPPADPDHTVSVIMVGDTSLARGVEDVTKVQGYDYPFSGVTDWLKAADVAVGNYEGVIAADGVGKQREQGYRLRAQPDAAPALARAGFKVLNLANNHTMDFGVEGLQSTITQLQNAGIGVVGVGANGDAARTPLVTTVKGVKIAWLSFTVVPDPPAGMGDPENTWTRSWANPQHGTAKVSEAVRAARAYGDVLIVQFHWGYEYNTCPREWASELGTAAIDAGAAIIAGHHPHVMQPYQTYHNRLIAYSLGNFVFDQTRTPGLALWLRLDRDGIIDARAIMLTPGVQPQWQTPDQTRLQVLNMCVSK